MNKLKGEYKWNNQVVKKLFMYVGLLVFMSYVAWHAIEIYVDYPLMQGRDWLSIFADFGQAVGGLAIMGIIFEIYRYFRVEREEGKKRIPKLTISRTIPLAESFVEGSIVCLNEATRDDLPLPESLERLDQYREMWVSMGPPANHGNQYLRIDISNNQSYVEANIVSLQLQIRLKYWGENPRQAATAMTFWCPTSASNISLEVGKSMSLYVRCGKLTDNTLSNISGEILDFRCTTAKRDTHYGKAMGFDKIIIPTQNFVVGNA